jgi:hypothetical protein
VKNWQPVWTVDKWYNSDDFERGLPPNETVTFEGNVLTNAGITALLTLLIGGGGTPFNSSNCHLGVGNSSTAENPSQTDLQGSSKERKIVDSAPSRTAQTLTFVSTFGPTNANFSWNEFGIFNAASGGTMLSRKVSSLGTKASGSTWVLTVTLTIS